MTFHDQLLAEVEGFLAETGLSPSALGRIAVNDGKIVSRLRTHKGITFRTATRLREAMADERARRQQQGAA